MASSRAWQPPKDLESSDFDLVDIEWYDFLLYSTVTGMVFAKLYFPQSDPLIGTMQATRFFSSVSIVEPIVLATTARRSCERRSTSRKIDPSNFGCCHRVFLPSSTTKVVRSRVSRQGRGASSF
jgi:hypothetical protein